MRGSRLLFLASLLFSTGWAGSFLFAAEPAEDESTHTYNVAPQITTEDPELKEQIVKVEGVLGDLHTDMTQRRNAIKQETDPAKKAALYAELDKIRRERDTLERILHELVEEATATEWTKIDEALKRARTIEKYQERAYRREEVIRDRQQ